jgi:hypothetical protein
MCSLYAINSSCCGCMLVMWELVQGRLLCIRMISTGWLSTLLPSLEELPCNSFNSNRSAAHYKHDVPQIAACTTPSCKLGGASLHVPTTPNNCTNHAKGLHSLPPSLPSMPLSLMQVTPWVYVSSCWASPACRSSQQTAWCRRCWCPPPPSCS